MKLSIRFCGVMFYAVLSATGVLACTFEEGADPIGANNRIAWTFGFLSGSIVLAIVTGYFLRKRKGRWVIIVSIIMLAIHPAWFLSSRIGDCGNAKVVYSQWFTALLGILAIYQFARWLLSRHKPIA